MKGERDGKLSFADRSLASGEGTGGVCRAVDDLYDAEFMEGLCKNTGELADSTQKIECHNHNRYRSMHLPFVRFTDLVTGVLGILSRTTKASVPVRK